MTDNATDNAPYIEPKWCGLCGKTLVWCGVRAQWVDTAHRSSHTMKDGTRRPHIVQGTDPGKKAA